MPNAIVKMVVALLIVGVILYFAAPYMPAVFVQIIIAVAVIGSVIWLLSLLGFWTGPPN